MSQFEALRLRPEILRAVNEMGFRELFPIQARAIQPLLEGRDVIGQAHTGTGKTAAYSLPMLDKVDTRKTDVQGLVLTPTRELAVQVAGEIKKFGKYLGVRVAAIYGGQGITVQINTFKRPVHIVVATPGRLIDHIRRRIFNLNFARIVVMDEADTMLDMGFLDDVEFILARTPRDRQTSLFSATMPPEIISLAQRHLKNPVKVLLSEKELGLEEIDQIYMNVQREHKIDTLRWLLDHFKIEQAIIFCNTKVMVSNLSERLQRYEYPALALHGDLRQSQRDLAMKRFREGGRILLVATDVAARGIDVPQVTHIINYDIPRYPLLYFHRIGRTARAGRAGTAITLVTAMERQALQQIRSKTRIPIREMSHPFGYRPAKSESERKMKHSKMRPPKEDWKNRSRRNHRQRRFHRRV
ncbi:MAG: DEAD/DEAH box helicase [Thaumarchaeota archaeon]|nr:DEAD/DEAH box helicase [Nitrososphaerota archaeon]